MPTSRFLRAAQRTRAVAGGTSVGGATATTVNIFPDGSIGFNDRFGNAVRVQGNPTWTTTIANQPQPGSKLGWTDDPDKALFRLVDALIART